MASFIAYKKGSTRNLDLNFMNIMHRHKYVYFEDS